MQTLLVSQVPPVTAGSNVYYPSARCFSFPTNASAGPLFHGFSARFDACTNPPNNFTSAAAEKYIDKKNNENNGAVAGISMKKTCTTRLNRRIPTIPTNRRFYTEKKKENNHERINF